ncbi:hypothetical protein [Actinomadura verrucosospora]|uniref:Transcriptional regulator n=1 Tax=Actinomadura verrucosospora TaxID=46165 RepID=A0A7D3VSZ3_ACTVE|nr:hypothetical protein [Actinomadura verrucosospora]QKG21879.1 transcriptional regulator [Actinomadura verrucosospora]
MSLTLAPIGRVVGGRDEAFDDGWGAVSVAIELDASRFTPDALAGLDVKPYMREFGPRGEVRQPAWSGELMAEYY